MTDSNAAYLPRSDVAFCAVRADGKQAEVGDFTWTSDPDVWIDQIGDGTGDDYQPVVIYRAEMVWKPWAVRCDSCLGTGWIARSEIEEDDVEARCAPCGGDGWTMDAPAESVPSPQDGEGS